MEIKLYNTLTSKKEVFEPLEPGTVKMYNCGPTVYSRQHIGNLSMFVFTDILRRTLKTAGYRVDQVINITDFGHLSGDNQGDADQGEDKMTRGLREEGLEPTLPNMRKLAEKFAGLFFEDLKKLNIETDGVRFPYASDYIDDQIELIKKLFDKGLAYETEDGLYFDTSKFPDYGKLGNINLKGLEEGARISSKAKRGPTDFILWKSDQKTGWQSPWGMGFPGWHIECSAMIIKLLGEQIDIHTGGIEHIPVHHNNEIAQSESATGKKPFSRFWLHRAHLKTEGAKISKSEGRVFYLDDLSKRGLHPLSFRYLLLTSHYKTPANFTYEAVKASQIALEKLVASMDNLPDSDQSDEMVLKKFEEHIFDDLNTPLALALLQETKSKRALRKMDEVLGFNIDNLYEQLYESIPDDISELKRERDQARINKDWARSDSLREQIEKQGYLVEDRPYETYVRRTFSLLVK